MQPSDDENCCEAHSGAARGVSARGSGEVEAGKRKGRAWTTCPSVARFPLYPAPRIRHPFSLAPHIPPHHFGVLLSLLWQREMEVKKKEKNVVRGRLTVPYVLYTYQMLFFPGSGPNQLNPGLSGAERPRKEGIERKGTNALRARAAAGLLQRHDARNLRCSAQPFCSRLPVCRRHLASAFPGPHRGRLCDH
jgi:hypothetical protein